MKASRKALMRDGKLSAPLTFPDGTAEGTFLSRFSTYNVIDDQGDVMLPGSVPAGQETAMVWSHQWDGLPVARGVTEEDDGGANLRGAFFMDTTAGLEAYRTVKNMGGLQEYSFGFRTLDAEFGEFEDGSGVKRPVRFVKRIELYEVSPVLIGANRNTGTLAIKSAGSADDGDDADDDDNAAELLESVETLEDFLALDDDDKLTLYYATRDDATGEKAVWSTAFVNNLPDSAFALIEDGGKLDDSGKTTPRSLRHFPHHDKSGSVDAPHVRNGLGRAPQASSLTQAQRDRATAHLRRHANSMGIGKRADGTEPFDDVLVRLLDEGRVARDRAIVIRALRADDGRTLSAVRVEQLRNLGGLYMALGQQLQEVTTTEIPPTPGDDPPAPTSDGPSLEMLRLRHQARIRRMVETGVLEA